MPQGWWAWCSTLVATLVVAQPRPRPVAVVSEFPTPFTRIGGIRELRDGRVILVDRQEQALMLLDWRSREARSIGRRGAGPQEYELPDALVAVPGDSTWLWDAMNFRWLVLDPQGRPLRTWSAVETSKSALNSGDYLGSDREGNIYLRTEASSQANPFAGTVGRGAILRLSRTTWRLDTVATLRIPAGRVLGVRPVGDGYIRRINNLPLAAEDVAAVAPDGRVAVIRVPEYRVEWHRPGASPVLGPEVTHKPLPVTAEERRAFIRAQTIPGRIILTGVGSAPGPKPKAMPSRTLPPGATDEDAEDLPWPAHLPPALPGARVAPDGTLWVLRSRPHSQTRPLFDLVNARGEVVGSVELPPRTRLQGFGQRHLYLVRIDEDDQEFLQQASYPGTA